MAPFLLGETTAHVAGPVPSAASTPAQLRSSLGRCYDDIDPGVLFGTGEKWLGTSTNKAINKAGVCWWLFMFGNWTKWFKTDWFGKTTLHNCSKLHNLDFSKWAGWNSPIDVRGWLFFLNFGDQRARLQPWGYHHQKVTCVPLIKFSKK